MKSITIYLYFFRFLKNYRLKIVFLTIVLLLGIALNLAQPFLYKIIIDEVIPNQDLNKLLWVLVVFLGIFLGIIVTNYITVYLYNWVANKIMLDLRKDLFRHLVQLPMKYYDKSDAGEFTHRINNEVLIVQEFILSAALKIISNIFFITGLVALLVWQDYKLFLITSLSLPLIAYVIKHYQPKIRQVTQLSRKKSAHILKFFIEHFENIYILKAFNRYEQDEKQLSGEINTLINYNMSIVDLGARNNNIVLLIASLSTLVIYGLGAYHVIDSKMTIGVLVTFAAYFVGLQNRSKEMVGLYVSFVKASVSMKRIYEYVFVAKNQERNNPPGTHKIKSFRKIKLSGLSLKYDKEIVLDDISFEFDLTKKYVILGPSGIGKSSLINLLLGFYKQHKGTIKLDDVNYEDVDIDEFRSQTSIIPQRSYFYNGSVYDNIKYSNPNCHDEKINEAANLAGIDFGLPLHKIDARNLSEGQKQRVAIARAAIRDFKILFLDEATSNLDSESENIILDNLLNTFHDKCIISVTHRVSTAKKFDFIIYLNKGQIFEFGTHKELLLNKGGYHSHYLESQGL